MQKKHIIVVILLVAVILLVSLLYKQKLPQRNTPQQGQTVSTPIPQPKTLEEAEPNLVTVDTSGFTPSTLHVKVGGKVVWVNKSGKIASLASADHPTHLKYPLLNLGEFVPGTTVQLVFPKSGTYSYHNHLNPSQTGSIVVE